MAYGQIYNTTWWGNALDTARTAGTEPDFFGSQMKLLTSEQDNLVVNGDFATDSDWNYFSQWNISNNKANFLDTSGGVIYQNGVTLTSGKNYEIKFTISNSLGNASLLFANANGSVVYYGSDYASYADGSYSLFITIPSSQTTFGVYGNTAGNSFSIDNVSVQLVRLDLNQIEAKKCLADWIHVTALQDLNN